MKKTEFLPTLTGAARRTGLAAWQTGAAFRRLAARALDAVQDVLRAEIERGNLRLVTDFLTDQALPVARTLLLERMTVRLLARLGLRGALASNVAGWVLPFVIEKLLAAGASRGLLAKLKTHVTVAEALDRLGELRHAAWKLLVPDPGSGAELVAETAADVPAPALPPVSPTPLPAPGGP